MEPALDILQKPSCKGESYISEQRTFPSSIYNATRLDDIIQNLYHNNSLDNQNKHMAGRAIVGGFKDMLGQYVGNDHSYDLTNLFNGLEKPLEVSLKRTRHLDKIKEIKNAVSGIEISREQARLLLDTLKVVENAHNEQYLRKDGELRAGKQGSSQYHEKVMEAITDVSQRLQDYVPKTESSEQGRPAAGSYKQNPGKDKVIPLFPVKSDITKRGQDSSTRVPAYRPLKTIDTVVSGQENNPGDNSQGTASGTGKDIVPVQGAGKPYIGHSTITEPEEPTLLEGEDNYNGGRKKGSGFWGGVKKFVILGLIATFSTGIFGIKKAGTAEENSINSNQPLTEQGSGNSGLGSGNNPGPKNDIPEKNITLSHLFNNMIIAGEKSFSADYLNPNPDIKKMFIDKGLIERYKSRCDGYKKLYEHLITELGLEKVTGNCKSIDFLLNDIMLKVKDEVNGKLSAGLLDHTTDHFFKGNEIRNLPNGRGISIDISIPQALELAKNYNNGGKFSAWVSLDYGDGTGTMASFANADKDSCYDIGFSCELPKEEKKPAAPPPPPKEEKVQDIKGGFRAINSMEKNIIDPPTEPVVPPYDGPEGGDREAKGKVCEAPQEVNECQK